MTTLSKPAPAAPQTLFMRLASFTRARHFAVILLISLNLITGLLTFQDYGVTWDEPLFYRYANAVSSAYSIPARIQGNFQIEKSYGPTDHRYYGPAYLLLARPAVAALKQLTALRESDLWHLANFVDFQVGALLLYILMRRWVRRWAAFATVLLFSTQPFLWGHAWINPKDMPFLVFFLGALLSGLWMVDRWVAPGPGGGAALAEELPARAHQKRRRAAILSIAFVGLTLALLLFSRPLENGLAQLIHWAHTAPAGSLVARLYAVIAAQAAVVPESAYVQKALTLFGWFKLLAVLLSAALLLAYAVRRFLPRQLAWARAVLAPLPAWPVLRVPGQPFKTLLLPALVGGAALGLVTSIRVLGPLAGALVLLYFLCRAERRSWLGPLLYLLVTLAVTYLTWPFLWAAPLARFVDVFKHMANNPQILPVLYGGAVFMSDKLPAAYLPSMMALTLTEPALALFLLGLAAAVVGVLKRTLDWRSLLAIVLWLLIPLAYVGLTRPPLYDSYRHFLFLAPVLFIFIGLALQFLADLLRPLRRSPIWINLLLAAAVLPGLVGLASLHPYEYTYYNALVGGTSGAFRRYETDFWLTCYRQILSDLQKQTGPAPVTVFVHRSVPTAKEYAPGSIQIQQFDPGNDATFPGSYLLLTTRTNSDLQFHPQAPLIDEVRKGSAVFCLLRQIQ